MDADPAGTVRGAGVGAARRPPRGGGRSRTWTRPPPRRLAALEGLVALGVDPRRWWFQRDWTDTGAPLHESIRVSYSKLSTLENCELQYVLSAELGLGGLVGYHAWVGKTVHKIIEDCENGSVDASLAELAAVVDERWRPQEFPSTAVSETWTRLAKERCCRTGSAGSASIPRPARERGFEFAYDGVTINGYIDRIGPDPLGFGTRITDYKTGGTYAAPKANESLQLGHLLPGGAGGGGPEGGRRRSPACELAYLKGDFRTGEIVMREWEVGSGEREAEYQERHARAAVRADRASSSAGRRGAVPAELAGELLLLRLQDALLAVSGGRAAVPDGATRS